MHIAVNCYLSDVGLQYSSMINMVFNNEDKILINIFLQSSWGKARYFKHQKYQNLWMNNKVRGDLNAISSHFAISAEYL